MVVVASSASRLPRLLAGTPVASNTEQITYPIKKYITVTRNIKPGLMFLHTAITFYLFPGIIQIADNILMWKMLYKLTSI